MRLIAGVLLLSATFGCQAIADRFGSQDDDKPAPESPAQDAAEKAAGDTEAERAPDDGTKKRRKKKGRRKGKRSPAENQTAAPEPALALEPALARAIVRGTDGKPTRVDPFVLTLMVETLERDEGGPFTRTTKAQRKAGVPAGLKVGPLEAASMWTRLGLREGDYVLAVGSARPPGPKRARALLQTLPLDPAVTVELQRNGHQKKLAFEVVPGLAWQRYLEQEASRSFAPDKAPPSSRRSDPKAAPRPSSGPKSKPPQGSKPTPTATPVRVTCSGSTCSIPKSDFDRLVGSSSRAKKEARGKSTSSGYQLTFVGPGARKAGFRVGDVIRKINGKSTNNSLHMLSLYGGLKATRKFRVESTRGSSKRTMTLLVK